MRFKAPHLSVRQDKRVKVILRSGEIFTDHFKESKSRYVVFRDKGRILNHDIRSMIITKE